MAGLSSGDSLDSRLLPVKDTQLDNTSGITIQCGGLIKSLSGEGISEGFTAEDFIPHTDSTASVMMPAGFIERGLLDFLSFLLFLT